MNLCPTCHGSGRIWTQVDGDHRLELACETCGATGRADLALYDAFSGDAQERKIANEKMRLELRIRGSHRGYHRMA